MKKYLLSATFGFTMVAMLFSSGNVRGQEGLPGPDYQVADRCYCGQWVEKCRYDGFTPCMVSAQIPCTMVCGD